MILFLKKVEISGFKSFASKATLDFSLGGFSDGKKGITAVVGPNGSGKSNVADAIKWAMGEQSMKTLRGKKTEDVIFAGSGKKGKLSLAKVTLFFDNSDKRIPIEFSEVTITRKLFRNGESEYLINESKVRLLDVIDLLAKGGLGRESYCVINQGMTDTILKATPAERRTVLEDAAGVKHFQIKKERSIKKLDQTKENLDRVGDLIEEIKPHLRMLKRQAERAQQGKDIALKLKEKQISLYSFLWHSFSVEKDKIMGDKNEVGALMMNSQREVDKMEDEMNAHSKDVQNYSRQEELEKQKRQLSQKMNDSERELIITEGRIVVEKEKQKNQKIIAHIPVDLVFVKSKLEDLKIRQEQLIERIAGVEKMEDLQDIKEFARAINQELHELYKNVGEGKIEVKSASVEAMADEEGSKITKMEARMEEVKIESGKLKTEISGIEKAIADEIEKNKQQRREFFELEKRIHQKQSELDKFKDKFNDIKIQLARLEVREEDLSNSIKNELKMEVGDLKYDGKPVDRDQLEREINKLKIQWEQVGGIDPMIVEEFEETQKRFEFLTKESEDLRIAIQSLKEVVKEMDAKINEEFSKAYEKINEEFTKYFRIIFGGGNAHLTKSKVQKVRKAKSEAEENDLGIDKIEADNQDSEESTSAEATADEVGIDISACPPGKKISNLAMLSGGERSLTSLALLFAIISYNPPPFAILDEVEAALDEANSKRFARIIKELSDDTQFIIISHNRETMRQASVLYGVTMGEDGVSKLLSVKLDQVGEQGEIIK
jgi:chromosome segregation protein